MSDRINELEQKQAALADTEGKLRAVKNEILRLNLRQRELEKQIGFQQREVCRLYSMAYAGE